MQDPLFYLSIEATALAALVVIAVAAARGWKGWLDLKRVELARTANEPAVPSASARIELADLKERVRKLEAIAAGVDL